MSTYNLKRIFIPGVLFIILLLTLSCKNEQPSITDTNTSDTAIVEDENENTMDTAATKNEVQPKDLVYTWVDKLNVRDAPNLNGKTITTIQAEDALEFTGIKSDRSETIVLRGIAYIEPWLKIITPDGKQGWVFGGAINLKDEKKGNATIDDKKFDYPYFGSFDLTKWKIIDTKSESGGDVDINSITYSNSRQTIEISKVEVGERGYGNEYKLYDNNQKLLKQRSFNFNVDSDLKEIVEIVIDYTSAPPKKYFRSQKMSKHFFQMNARPLMANGTWEESTLDNTPPPK